MISWSMVAIQSKLVFALYMLDSTNKARVYLSIQKLCRRFAMITFEEEEEEEVKKLDLFMGKSEKEFFPIEKTLKKIDF